MPLAAYIVLEGYMPDEFSFVRVFVDAIYPDFIKLNGLFNTLSYK